MRKNYETVTRRLTEMQNKEKELEGRSKTVKASALQSQEKETPLCTVNEGTGICG